MKDFFKLAEEKLEDLQDKIDAQYGENADVFEENNTIKVEFDSGEIYIISININSQEIWFASPTSGAHHYKIVDDLWKNTRDSQAKNLEDQIFFDLKNA